MHAGKFPRLNERELSESMEGGSQVKLGIES